MEKGKVWLLGAGPGDAGLLTLKGKEMLEKADTVVYDSLVGPAILAMIPGKARQINVGKRAGHHTMPQEEINKVLLEESLKGQNVVRLKGGDPFLFGRGGEELELLKENGIPYEIIPGVTSAIAVPAYNGIPVTHRDFCSSVHIITGHKRDGKSSGINYKALVSAEGTLVFLMGVTALPDICRGLMEAGMDPKTPAAVLQQGTTAGQRRVLADLKTLPEEAASHEIHAPAIIVVGKVCALSEEFAWREHLPLFGKRVIVTRPKESQSKMAERLREEGAEVLELPTIETVPVTDRSHVLEAAANMASYKWLVFTSPAGVRIFFDMMKDADMDIRSIGQVKIAAIGRGTSAGLKERGLFADLMPEIYDGEHLGKALAAVVQKGDRVLIPRAEIGNQELVQILTEAGAVVDDAAAYRTVYRTSLPAGADHYLSKEIMCIAAFTSSSTVEGFVRTMAGADFSFVRAACIGHKTAETAEKYGMKWETAQEASIESLINLIKEMAE